MNVEPGDTERIVPASGTDRVMADTTCRDAAHSLLRDTGLKLDGPKSI